MFYPNPETGEPQSESPALRKRRMERNGEKTRLRSRAPFPRLRLSELERIIESRRAHGVTVVSDGRFLEIAAPLITALVKRARGDAEFAAPQSPARFVIGWARHFFPAASEATLIGLIARAASAPRMRADTVAVALGVTDEERRRLRLKTIGACDISTANRKALAAARKRDRDRERAAAKRRAAGSVAREAYEAGGITAEAARLGLSRWQLRRMRQKARDAASPFPHGSVAGEDHLSFFMRDGPVRSPSAAPESAPMNAHENASEDAG